MERRKAGAGLGSLSVAVEVRTQGFFPMSMGGRSSDINGSCSSRHSDITLWYRKLAWASGTPEERCGHII